MTVTRTFDLLEKYKTNPFKEDALCFKHNGEWIKYSSKDYIDFAYSFCYGLYEMGYRMGDKIVTISPNRPEWNFVDMGMAMLGVVHVPVFTSLNTPEFEHIINHSEAKMVIVSDIKLHRCIKCAVDNAITPVQVFTFYRVVGIPNCM